MKRPKNHDQPNGGDIRDAPTVVFEVVPPQARAARCREFEKLPLEVLRLIQKDLERVITARETVGRSDLDIAAGVQEASLIHSVHKDDVRLGKNRRLQRMKVYCCKDHCSECPHGPYWFLVRFVRSRNEIVARAHAGPALPPEVIEGMRQDVRPGKAYRVELDTAKDRRG